MSHSQQAPPPARAPSKRWVSNRPTYDYDDWSDGDDDDGGGGGGGGGAIAAGRDADIMARGRPPIPLAASSAATASGSSIPRPGTAATQRSALHAKAPWEEDADEGDPRSNQNVASLQQQQQQQQQQRQQQESVQSQPHRDILLAKTAPAHVAASQPQQQQQPQQHAPFRTVSPHRNTSPQRPVQQQYNQQPYSNTQRPVSPERPMPRQQQQQQQQQYPPVQRPISPQRPNVPRHASPGATSVHGRLPSPQRLQQHRPPSPLRQGVDQQYQPQPGGAPYGPPSQMRQVSPTRAASPLVTQHSSQQQQHQSRASPRQSSPTRADRPEPIVPKFPQDFRSGLSSRALTDGLLETAKLPAAPGERRNSIGSPTESEAANALVSSPGSGTNAGAANRTPSILLAANNWAEKKRMLKEQLASQQNLAGLAAKSPSPKLPSLPVIPPAEPLAGAGSADTTLPSIPHADAYHDEGDWFDEPEPLPVAESVYMPEPLNTLHEEEEDEEEDAAAGKRHGNTSAVNRVEDRTEEEEEDAALSPSEEHRLRHTLPQSHQSAEEVPPPPPAKDKDLPPIATIANPVTAATAVGGAPTGPSTLKPTPLDRIVTDSASIGGQAEYSPSMYSAAVMGTPATVSNSNATSDRDSDEASAHDRDPSPEPITPRPNETSRFSIASTVRATPQPSSATAAGPVSRFSVMTEVDEPMPHDTPRGGGASANTTAGDRMRAQHKPVKLEDAPYIEEEDGEDEYRFDMRDSFNPAMLLERYGNGLESETSSLRGKSIGDLASVARGAPPAGAVPPMPVAAQVHAPARAANVMATPPAAARPGLLDGTVDFGSGAGAQSYSATPASVAKSSVPQVRDSPASMRPTAPARSTTELMEDMMAELTNNPRRHGQLDLQPPIIGTDTPTSRQSADVPVQRTIDDVGGEDSDDMLDTRTQHRLSIGSDGETQQTVLMPYAATTGLTPVLRGAELDASAGKMAAASPVVGSDAEADVRRSRSLSRDDQPSRPVGMRKKRSDSSSSRFLEMMDGNSIREEPEPQSQSDDRQPYNMPTTTADAGGIDGAAGYDGHHSYKTLDPKILDFKDIWTMITSAQRTAELRRRTELIQNTSSGLSEYLAVVAKERAAKGESMPAAAVANPSSSSGDGYSVRRQPIAQMLIPGNLGHTTQRTVDRSKDAAKGLLRRGKNLFSAGSQRSVSAAITGLRPSSSKNRIVSGPADYGGAVSSPPAPPRTAGSAVGISGGGAGADKRASTASFTSPISGHHGGNAFGGDGAEQRNMYTYRGSPKTYNFDASLPPSPQQQQQQSAYRSNDSPRSPSIRSSHRSSRDVERPEWADATLPPINSALTSPIDAAPMSAAAAGASPFAGTHAHHAVPATAGPPAIDHLGFATAPLGATAAAGGDYRDHRDNRPISTSSSSAPMGAQPHEPRDSIELSIADDSATVERLKSYLPRPVSTTIVRQALLDNDGDEARTLGWLMMNAR